MPESASAAAVFHPSLGQSGYLVSYLPCSLHGDLDNSFKPLLVTVPPASMPLIFAHRQWRAGMLLADLIYSEVVNVKGLKVLELGAGTGLPGIVTALKQKVSEETERTDEAQIEEKREGGFVLITDYDEPSLVKTLRANVARNLADDWLVRSKSYKSGGVRVVGHCWGKALDDLLDFLPSPGTLQLSSSTTSEAPLIDIILLADCLWDPLSHSDLLKTITSTLARTRSSKVVVVSGLHTGRETLVSFMRRANRLGLKLEPLSPGLEESFSSIDEGGSAKGTEAKRPGPDQADPLYRAEDIILEVELSGQDEVVVNDIQKAEASLPDQKTPTELSKTKSITLPAVNCSTSDLSSHQDQTESAHSSIEAHHRRLTGKRRRFVIEERDEERKEIGGFKRRNRWMTLWALGWKEEML